MLKAFLIEELSELKTKKQKLELPSADLEVQLVQLNHCDGVYLLKYLIKKLKTLAIHQVLCLDPPFTFLLLWCYTEKSHKFFADDI